MQRYRPAVHFHPEGPQPAMAEDSDAGEFYHREDVAELEALTESLQNRWASRPLSSEDAAVRIAELERVRSAASRYYSNWCRDEAEDPECCTEQQHEEAKALRDALNAVL